MIEEKTEAAQKVEEAKAAQAASSGDKPTMHIKIYSPFKIYFDQDGYSITGANRTGPFDILPHHHNFMTLLDACELLIRPITGAEQRIRISGGLMNVKADKVTVFLDI
jgi:F-type H+-transporting ATPase subunit epsilon